LGHYHIFEDHMSTSETTIRALDAAYEPFPPFSVWAEKCSVDPVRWNRYLATLQLASGDKPEDNELFKRARDVASRAAAIETGAIEGLYEVDRGFTYTVAAETSAWEATFSQKSEEVRSLITSQMHAYEFVLTLATSSEPISEAAVRKLHEEITKSQSTYLVTTPLGPQQQALPKGKYKALPNHVRTREGTDHSYAPVDQTGPEMQRLMTEIRQEALQSAHPVLQAAYAHYAFVAIHPFADGNGRVARALASAFTYRSISMPVMIFSDLKAAYLDALQDADAGHYQSFVDFILNACLDTMSLVDESLKAARASSREQRWEELEKYYLTRGGYTDQQVKDAGDRLGALLKESFDQAIAEKMNKSNGRLSGTAQLTNSAPRTVPPPNSVTGNQCMSITFLTKEPVSANNARQFFSWLPRDASGDDDLHMMAARNDLGHFSARMAEIFPNPTTSLRIRARMFADRITNEMVDEVIASAITVGVRLRGRK
jgi:Fic family protein